MRRAILLGILVGAWGCATTASFKEDAFHGEKSQYKVRYLDAGKQSLLPAQWRLMNFSVDSKGRPEFMLRGDAYRSKIKVETENGTGLLGEIITHDLKFSHAQSEGFLWLRVLPLPNRIVHKSLKVVAQEWANGLTGTALDFSFGSGSAPSKNVSVGVDSQRVATTILTSQPREIAGHKAHEVLFDMVNMDQLEMNPNAPRTRVRAVFIQAPVTKKTPPPGEYADVSAEFAACLFVGYANSAESFDRLTPAFDDFLSRLEISSAP
jgi:hypothetical protein